jgi:hypothetical protein
MILVSAVAYGEGNFTHKLLIRICRCASARLNPLMQTRENIHREGNISLQVSLQCLVQTLELVRAPANLAHITVKRDKLGTLDNL